MLKKILVVGTMALGMGALSAQAQINNDVYIDYSVLDELVGTNNPKVHNQPLFPEVKKAPRVKASKPRPVTKPATKAAEKPKVEAKKVEKITIPEKVTIKEIVPPKAKPEAKAPILETPKTVSEPIAPSTATEKSVPQNPAESKPAPITKPEVNIPAQKPAPAEKVVPQVKEPEVPVVEKSAPETTQPTPAPQAKEALTDNKIYFAEESATLTEADKKKIDKLLQSFGNPQENKIAINSYNFEDGKDVFKKKRRSLDRAIAVRSYLLSKKYKNFSIKVVNVTDDESKKNLVEIEEIK